MVPWNTSVTLMMNFESITAGPFVYHCHILNHEDLGMMANICAGGSCPNFTNGTGHSGHR